MKVEIELPELPGFEYTGEWRVPNPFEPALVNGHPLACQYWYGQHFILRPKQKPKPKIVIYQWLINHNTNNDGDVEDCGYRICTATEDHIASVCKEFGWTFKKFSPSPLWSLDGDTL
jgi:hypothetical protein